MLKSKSTYKFMQTLYDDRVFVIVAKVRLENVTFQDDFVLVGECFNAYGKNKDFPKRAYEVCNRISELEFEEGFNKRNLIINKNGVIIVFNEENKEYVMSFFNSIPFFTS